MSTIIISEIYTLTYMKYKKIDHQLHLPHIPIKISTNKVIKDPFTNIRTRPYSSSKLNDL
jgi:hypothetical protein